MATMRRVFFFIGLNIVVVLTLSLVMQLLGIRPYLTSRGLDYGALIGFCLVWGMGGAFISLLLSKTMAKWSMGVQIIDPRTHDPNARRLVETVHQLARSAGLTRMPEVGLYNSPEINAFATGPSKKNSLVAVSTGLLNHMNDREVEGVLGHEVAHIANGDMVTMTLLQGVVNAFVMALARIIAFAIDNLMRNDREEGGGLGMFAHAMVVMALEMVLFIPGSMVIAWFSRQREYRADRDSARIAGRDKMISALRSLQKAMGINDSPDAQTSQAMASLKISSSRSGRFMLLMSTHPSLESRIAALERGL